MACPRNRFLPSIFEEKHDDKIQDVREVLQITEDDEEEGSELMVRLALQNVEGEDSGGAIKELSMSRKAGGTGKLKPLVRSTSESRLYWPSKRQGSGLVGSNRIQSGIVSGRSFGHRKITSPGVNRARQLDVPEVIDLTNTEQVKEIARRFFQEELKMDLLDQRFDKPDDFFSSLRLKVDQKFSYGELWQRRRSVSNLSVLKDQLLTLHLEKERELTPEDGKDEKAPYFQIFYSKPVTLNYSSDFKKALTTSFIEQKEYDPTRRHRKILNPIKRDGKRTKHSPRYKALYRPQEENNKGRK